MDILYLKKYVGERLDSLTTINVYSKVFPENGTYPCLIYKLSSATFDVRLRTDFICEIDFWDDTNDDTTIMQEAEKIKAGFDYYYQSETQGFYQSHIIFFGEIPDIKPDISRIQQRYLLKVR